MGIAHVLIISALLLVTQGGQAVTHPEMAVTAGPSSHEAYVPKAGPDCDADAFSARSDCSR